MLHLLNEVMQCAIASCIDLDILILAKAHVPAEARYESVALGHWRLQHLKEQRINITSYQLSIHLLWNRT